MVLIPCLRPSRAARSGLWYLACWGEANTRVGGSQYCHTTPLDIKLPEFLFLYDFKLQNSFGEGFRCVISVYSYCSGYRSIRCAKLIQYRGLTQRPPPYTASYALHVKPLPRLWLEGIHYDLAMNGFAYCSQQKAREAMEYRPRTSKKPMRFACPVVLSLPLGYLPAPPATARLLGMN